MARHKFHNEWCSMVQFFMDRHRPRMTQHALAERLGVSQPSIQAYLNGRSKPPIGAMEQWADALRLTGDDRERFLWLALQSHTPEVVWDRVNALSLRLVDLERQLADARQMLAASDAELGSLAKRVARTPIKQA